VELAGIYLPEPFTGWKAMKAGLLTSTYLEVEHVHQTRASYSSVVPTQEMVDEVERLGEEGNVFDRLAASIAPEIYGMLDVKKVGGGMQGARLLMKGVLECLDLMPRAHFGQS
jgi:DNA replication licensing factor MCM7